MPADSAKGRLAISAIQAVPMKDASAVASRTAVESIPAALRILGFTARMYAIVIKVVIPAMTSVLTVVLFAASLNVFSSIVLSLSSS